MRRRSKQQVKRGTKSVNRCQPAKRPALIWVDESAAFDALAMEKVIQRFAPQANEHPVFDAAAVEKLSQRVATQAYWVGQFSERDRRPTSCTAYASLQSLLLYAIAQNWTIPQLLDGDAVYPGGLRALFPGLQPAAHMEVSAE